jgi:hypothetical protein
MLTDAQRAAYDRDGFIVGPTSSRLRMSRSCVGQPTSSFPGRRTRSPDDLPRSGDGAGRTSTQ